MKLFSLSTVLAAALLSVVVMIPFLPFASPQASQFHFEITVTSSADGLAEVFFDVGRGFNPEDSARAQVTAGKTPQQLAFALPEGNYKNLRYDPLNRDGTFTLRDALIRGPDGRVIRRFALTDFIAENEISAQTVVGDHLDVTTVPRALDPILRLRVDQPFRLEATLAQNIRFLALRLLPILAGTLVLVWLVGRSRLRFQALWSWATAHPARAIAIGAVIAVIASSYPVIFLGKSIVSPNNGTLLLYEDYPTLPGYRDRVTANVSGADIGAIMWQQVPISMLQHNALLRDGELPLWNRYNSTGNVLLGQGQSMFGDPLHLFVILADGAAWAWDLKYLLAKWILACGVGLCVWSITRSLPAAMLVTFAVDFVGFFPFRVNHPAFFSFCYAPSVLYCWLRLTAAPRWTHAAAWAGVLILANGTLMNSGTVKEAYMLLLTLNFAGACALLFANLSWKERSLRFGLTAWAGLIFVSLSAPVWLTFLDALKKAYTSYDTGTAFQVQPSLALGFFDEVLLRPFWANEGVYNPSANFLLLTGVLGFLVYLRSIVSNRVVFALALASLLPLAIVFGLVPPLWIAHLPFLGNITHIDNSFGVGLILLLTILAGAGFAAAIPRLSQPEGRGDLTIAALLLLALVFPFIAFRQTVQRSTLSYLHWGETVPFSPFVWGSLAALLLAAMIFMLTARRLLLRGPSAASVLVLVTCIVVMLWRHGWHVGMGFDGRVVQPAVRADFHAKSPAIEALRADQKNEPVRTLGFQGNLFPGWNDVYRLEGLCGPDALMNPFFRELTEACGFTRIWDWRIHQTPEDLPARRTLYDFLNVRYYLAYKSDPTRLGAMLTPLKMGDLDLYRSETAWPRAFFTDRLATYASPKELIQLVATAGTQPFAAMQAVANSPRPDLPSNLADRTSSRAYNYRLTTNTTAFDIDATGPGLAVLSEAWLPRDFLVTLDGKNVPYLRLNHAFKGVAIPSAGRHHLEFTYRPARFTLALSLSAFALVLGACSGLAIWRLEKRNGQPALAPATV